MKASVRALVVLVMVGCSPLVAVAPLLALPGPASGEAACSRCHDVVPGLNASGLCELQAGMPAPRICGMWAAHRFPLAFRSAFGTSSTRGARPVSLEEVRGDLPGGRSSWMALGVVSAAPLGTRLAYHADAEFSSPTHDLELGRAYVHVSDLAPGGALNLTAGRFDVDLPFLASARRTSLADALAPVSLEDAQGLGFDGAHRGWTYALGRIRSARAQSAAPPLARFVDRLEDTYGWVMRDLGGQRIGARMLFDRQDSNVSFHAWLQHLQLECAARFGGVRFALVPGFVMDRFDDRPAPGIHERHDYALLEALARVGPGGRLDVTARVEREDRVRNADMAAGRADREVLDLAWSVRPHARAALEWSHDADPSERRGVTQADAFVRLGD